MELLIEIFGEGKDLTIQQMSCRGIVVFFIALLLIRISGRRSFGLHTPLDNIITILLGAILSRAVVGASAFEPVIIASLVIVSLHRVFGWLIVKYPGFAKLVEGDKRLLFSNGKFNNKELEKALLCQEDTMQGVRKSAMTETLEDIDKIYMERNGEVTLVKKPTPRN
jgi:uncharacterized membrane protein YcaP (DUF421 family)